MLKYGVGRSVENPVVLWLHVDMLSSTNSHLFSLSKTTSVPSLHLCVVHVLYRISHLSLHPRMSSSFCARDFAICRKAIINPYNVRSDCYFLDNLLTYYSIYSFANFEKLYSAFVNFWNDLFLFSALLFNHSTRSVYENKLLLNRNN